MEIRKVAQPAMNIFGCPEKKCEGTGFVPVTLNELARIRTRVAEKKVRTEFTCGHFHTVFLRCGHTYTLQDRPNA